MASSSKKTGKKSKAVSSEPKVKMDNTYCMLRDQDGEKLLVVPRSEIISAKNPSKLGVGDIVSYGKRGKRIRAEIILVGNEEQREQSLRIIERMETSSSQLAMSQNKNRSDNITGGKKQQKENAKDLVGEISSSEEEEDESEEEEEEEEEGFDLESTNKENTESIRKQDEKETNEAEEENISSSPVLADVSNLQSPRHDKGPLVSAKRKTSPNESDISTVAKSKRSKNIGFVSMREHARLVNQLAAANEQNELYQTTWMPRPVDTKTIDYLIRIGRILSDDNEDSSDTTGNAMDSETILSGICKTLGMSVADLNACKKQTILSTARQVIGARYPSATTIFADVDKQHIQAIIEYAYLMHPAEKKANNQSKVRHAMGNVFATRRFASKMKSGVLSSSPSMLPTAANNHTNQIQP